VCVELERDLRVHRALKVSARESVLIGYKNNYVASNKKTNSASQR